jgi:hypothetical protein
VLDAEEISELTELAVSEALFDTELETEDDTELIWLLAEEMEELTASDRLEADSEISEATDLTLLEALSTTPGSDPMIEDDALADRLLALPLATEAMLSNDPVDVPITALEA